MEEKKYETVKTDKTVEIKDLKTITGGAGEETFVEHCPVDGCPFYIIYHEPEARWIVDKEMQSHLQYCH